MGAVLKYPVLKTNLKNQYEFVDDFLSDQSDIPWVDVITDTGTALVNDAVNGVMVLTPSDGTVADNDEVYLHTANELFKFAAGKPFLGGARIQFTETASGVYNAMVGFMDAMGADSLTDNGAGPKVSGSTCVIYKVDGGTVWRCKSACNGVTIADSVSTTTAGGSSYQELEIEIVDGPGPTANVKAVFRVDGVPLKDSTTGAEIVHTIPVASATEMHFGFGAKLGAATNNDVLNCDYAYFAAARA